MAGFEGTARVGTRGHATSTGWTGSAPARPQLRLLGEFELIWRGEVAPMASGAQRLLAFLALKRAPVRRSHLAGALWIDSDEHRAGGNLRSALWRLRALGADIVRATSLDVRLSPWVRVDLDEATSLAAAIASPGTVFDVERIDMTPLTRDLLVGWYDDWIVFERERFRQIRLHALESLSERQQAQGLYAQAVQCAMAAIDGDPLRESAYRVLIKAHLAEGNHAEAIRQYRALSDLLMSDLGVAPSEEVASLVHALKPTA